MRTSSSPALESALQRAVNLSQKLDVFGVLLGRDGWKLPNCTPFLTPGTGHVIGFLESVLAAHMCTLSRF